MFKGRFSKEGFGLSFSDYHKQKLKEWIAKNPNTPFQIVPVLPESNKQRGFFEGALCPLIAFYQEGMDHRNHIDVTKVREWLKLEFNSDFVTIRGKTNKIALSTKNQLNKGFLEKVIEYLVENYSPPSESFDPSKYKRWRDEIYPFGGPETYIDYLITINIL